VDDEAALFASADAIQRQQVTPRAHLLAARRAGVLMQLPFSVRRIPGPQASRIWMMIPSGCWRGTGGMACANEAKVNEKATATNLIIASPPWMM
jgi:hypothetical protein